MNPPTPPCSLHWLSLDDLWAPLAGEAALCVGQSWPGSCVANPSAAMVFGPPAEPSGEGGRSQNEVGMDGPVVGQEGAAQRVTGNGTLFNPGRQTGISCDRFLLVARPGG